MTQCERVLKALKMYWSTGVTVENFPQGFRLAARVYDLRVQGYKIESRQVDGGVATYVLKGVPST